jgi:hypothetical protein
MSRAAKQEPGIPLVVILFISVLLKEFFSNLTLPRMGAFEAIPT